MVVSAISYGNWITHGGQVDEDAAVACVRAALDAGITTFDTADVYAGGQAEEVLGRALRGVRRDSIEIFTKVYWPTGPNPNNRGLSRKHIIESCDASLGGSGHRPRRPAPGPPLRRRDAARRDARAFDDLVRQGKVHYIGVSEWTAEPDRRRPAASPSRWASTGSSPTSPSTRCSGGSSRPRSSPLCRGGHRPDRVVAARPGRAHRQVPARGRAARGLPGDRPEGGDIIWLLRDEVLEPVQVYVALCRAAGPTPAEVALAWVLENENVAAPSSGPPGPSRWPRT